MSAIMERSADVHCGGHGLPAVQCTYVVPGGVEVTWWCMLLMTSGSLSRRFRGSISLMRSLTCRKSTSFALSWIGSMSKSKYACRDETPCTQSVAHSPIIHE